MGRFKNKKINKGAVLEKFNINAINKGLIVDYFGEDNLPTEGYYTI